MLKASSPPRFVVPFAFSAGGSFIRAIPLASQIGIQNGAASLTDGFPPLCFQPVASGGTPPFGSDMNGILNQLSQWSQWLEAGGPVYYDSTFATGGNGGYPQGAIVQSNIVPGNFWLSTADNNTTDPDSLSSANWVPDPGRIASGIIIPSFSTTVPTGYVPSNSLTIGNASSNATNRANSDTLLAYRAVWSQFSNTACPIYTSAGSLTTRGANADADFAANKALSTPDMRGRSLIGADAMNNASASRLVFVPIISGAGTSPASFIGENLHALTSGENGSHNHGTIDTGHNHSYQVAVFASITGGGAFLAGSGTSGSTTGTSTTGLGIGSSGSGTAHNTVCQSATVFWNMKL